MLLIVSSIKLPVLYNEEVKQAWLGMSRISQIFNSHRTYNSHSITINSLETSYNTYSSLLSTSTESGNSTVKSCKDELHKWFICYFMLTCFQQRLCSLYLLKKKLSSAQAVFTTKRQLCSLSFQKYLRRFCYMYNADFSPEWTDSVTHLIVGCEAKSDRLCRKTLKLLQALIAEKWVLSEFWIVQSVNKGKLLPPENFEITNVLNSEVEENFSHMSTICRNVNKNIIYEIAGKVSCRSYRVNRLPPFNDLHFFCCGPFTDISKAAICNLVTTGGGIVHKNINDLLRKKANRQNCFIIASCRNINFGILNKFTEIYIRYRIVTLDVSYIYRCIVRYKLLSIKPYLLMNRRDKNYTKENKRKMLDCTLAG
ncbi:Breast cancer type 1 susceptibility -like protein [Trichinella nelsoni]|uniref:Breast cancer type 1 susceptibility-like protein n=1 Tax=Trichinella nelsoni TaxID=6336 RepID=A0A0V0RJF3_9BILA|nr:Breast cancer type 1 susceptibility -like protein [Trichinella nelsoni]